MRPATSLEAAEDYRKRKAALEAAIADGVYSAEQAERYREELEHFTGYPRRVSPTGGES